MPFMKERLKEQRNARNITLLEVAESLGVAEATIQRYESGKIRKLDTLTVEKLANAVKCSPSYLMGWVDKPLQTNPIHVDASISNGSATNTSDGSMVALIDRSLSAEAIELLRIFESIEVRKRIKLLEFAFSLEDEREVT